MKRIVLFLSFVIFVSCAQNSLIGKTLNYNTIPVGESQESGTDSSYFIENDLELTVSPLISAPIGVTASKGDFEDRIEITWKPVVYGNKSALYYVYRSVDNKNYVLLNSSPLYSNAYTQYLDSDGLDAEAVYYYRVRAYSDAYDIAGHLSVAAEGYLVKGPSYFSASLRDRSDYVELRWKPVDGALYYTLERARVETGGEAPLSDKAYSRIGNPITESSYDEVSEQFVYHDFSTSDGGELIPQYDYFYRLYAHKDADTKSRPSYAARGALLAVGVPAQPVILNVTKGLIQDKVRITWNAVNCDSYLLYRITEEDLTSGNTVGTEIPNIRDSLINDASAGTVTYYDSDPAVGNGSLFYYRVAAKNSIGIGRSSAFETESDRTVSLGFGIRNFENESISVLVSREGFKVEWNPVSGAASYYIFRYGPVNPPGSVLGSSIAATDWQFVCETERDVTFWLDKESGADLEQEEMFYRVVPVGSFNGTDFLPGENSIFASDWGFTLPEELKSAVLYENGPTLEEMMIESPLGDSKIGWCGFSAPNSDYTIPVPEIISVSATQGDKNNRGSVRVTGKINISDAEIKNLSRLNFTLKRVCRYGDETGVYPLAEPRKSIGGVSFEKKGQPHIEAVEIYDLNQYFNTKTKEFVFNDPMHDFRDGKPIPDASASDGYRRHIWDYSAWDTEAWKDIKRQKSFDIERAVKIEYYVSIERKGDPEWNSQHKQTIGWPALTDLEFGHLANWMKDTALNRLSIIMIPRYAWTKTISYLMGADQKVYGENSKSKAAAYLTVQVNGLSGTGRGGIQNGYSDWKGFSIKTDKEIALTAGLDSNKRQTVTFEFSFTTPMYSGSCKMQIGVRDYNYQWGLWDNNGYVNLSYNGVGNASLKPDQLIPYYEAMNNGKQSVLKNGLVLGREAFDAGGEPFPFEGDTNSMCFTRINLKYRPIPVNSDFAKERYPEMYYGYQY